MKRILWITTVLATMCGIASATAIGTLNIAGLDNVRVTASTIDFAPLGPAPGPFIVVPSTGDFDAVEFATGAITDLALATATPGSPSCRNSSTPADS